MREMKVRCTNNQVQEFHTVLLCTSRYELFVPTPCQKMEKQKMLDIFSFSHQEFFVGHDIMFIFPG